MTARAPWIPVVLWMLALLIAAYAWMVGNTVRLRMENVSVRAEQLADLENGLTEFNAALAVLDELNGSPLPDVQQVVKDRLSGERVRVTEGEPLQVHDEWVQRRARVTVENCSLPALIHCLEDLQAGDTGWRLLSCELRSESTAGRAGGTLELAGLEPRSSGGGR